MTLVENRDLQKCEPCHSALPELAAKFLMKRSSGRRRMEKVVQLLDEIDEIIGLLRLGIMASSDRIRLNAGLLSLALVAVLLPV